MTAIQGIQFENDANGKPIYVRINLEEFGDQLEPFLKQVGILQEKDEFDLEWEKAIPSDEFLKRAVENIKKLPWKK
jgi:hypothetical protein